MTQRPAISIVIPAFNLEGYIGATLRSLISQTFDDWEAIVVDDASRDRTAQIAQELARQDTRIRVVSNSRTKGVSGARNTGIDQSRGQWIAFLDGDDLFDARALEYRMTAARAFPGCEFISGDFVPFNDSESINPVPQSMANERWRRILHPGGRPTTVATALERPVGHFVEQVITWTGCVTVKADLLRQLGGFNERLQTTEDDQLWVRVAAAVDRMIFEPRSLSLYRQRPNSLTNSGKALHRHSVLAYSLLLKDPLLRAQRQGIRRKMAYFAHQNSFYYRDTKQSWPAIVWSFKALTLDPLSQRSWRNLLASLAFR